MRWPVEIKSNFAAAVAIDAREEINEARKDKDNKYQYKANLNELIGVLKDKFVFAVAQKRIKAQIRMVNEIVSEVSRYVVPIRDNRIVPRNPSQRKAKFHHNQKASC
jgi:hypothetical protein